MVLYRPVGEKEWQWIHDSGCKRFPPCLPEQPIFYPVLDYDYACQIARDWNSKDPRNGLVGYVTQFSIDGRFARRYPVHTVGAANYRELWVPAAELEEFNNRIDGYIEVIAEFRLEPDLSC